MCKVFWNSRGILLARGETGYAERYCDGTFRTSHAGCLVEVLPCCIITHGHTLFDGQHISRKSSAVRCLLINAIARTSCPAISIFPYISRNSCPVSVSVFRMTERRSWVSHSGSNPRWQTHTIQGYQSWFHGKKNVLVAEVKMLKNSSTLTVSVPINFSIKLGFVSMCGLGETYFVHALRIDYCDIELHNQTVLWFVKSNYSARSRLKVCEPCNWLKRFCTKLNSVEQNCRMTNDGWERYIYVTRLLFNC